MRSHSDDSMTAVGTLGTTSIFLLLASRRWFFQMILDESNLVVWSPLSTFETVVALFSKHSVTSCIINGPVDRFVNEIFHIFFCSFDGNFRVVMNKKPNAMMVDLLFLGYSRITQSKQVINLYHIVIALCTLLLWYFLPEHSGVSKPINKQTNTRITFVDTETKHVSTVTLKIFVSQYLPI